MTTKSFWLAVVLCTCIFTTALAQEKNISGTITDQSGLPLPGVSVVISGTSNGTQTDFEGNYSITGNVGQVLRFSYIGQTTVQRTIGSSTTINVQMEDDAEALQEVVVQGYRTSTKEKSSIASVTISSETITSRPNANFAQTLSGQVAGLNITTSSGQPGGNTNINLRGVGSVNGNTEPLFIIDGAPVDEDNFRSLNSNDIASISVLKDAGATAIYGNRGANGVVIIKTRTGSFNQDTKISYTAQLSFNSLQNNDYDLMNAQEQLTLERDFGNGRGVGLTDAEIAASPDFDWVDFFFDTGLTQSHTLNITSGGENVNVFTSLGYFDQEGILQSSGLKRFNIRNNISGKSANDRFKYTSNFSINYSESDEPNNIGGSGINRNYVLGAYQSVPYITPDDYTNGEALLSPLSFANTPLFLLDRLLTYTREEAELKIIGSFNASYNLTDDIKASITLSGDFTDEHLLSAEGPTSFNALLFGGGANPTSGVQNQFVTRTFNYNQVLSLNYLKTIGKHTIDFGLYSEYFKAHYRFFGFTENGLNPKTFYPGDGDGFVSDNGDNDFFVDVASADILNAGLFSYFGQLDYDFDTRLGITGTIRRDASSRFSSSNRWGTFWSVAGRWNISNESFMEDSVFDVLKLRGSYGTTGNQNIVDATGQFAPFAAADLYLDLFTTGTGYAGLNSIIPAQLGNPILKWEEIEQANIGLDFEIFNRRLRGSIDGYIKTTKDLFQDTPLSAINGQTELEANVGSLENKGIDLTLNYNLLQGGADGINISIGLNGNYNKQENLEIPTEDGTIVEVGSLTGRQVGGPLNEYFVYRYSRVNPENGNLLFLTTDGEETEDPNVDTDRVWLGKNIYPDYQGGFTFDLDYKGFFLSTQFNYVIGVDRYDFDLSGFQDPTSIGQFRHSSDILRAWTPDNTVTDIASLTASNLSLIGNSDRYLTSADYLRLRFVQVGYSIPPKVLENTWFTNIRLFANAENLVTFSEWRGFDAETVLSTGSREYPSPRIYSFGLEFGF
ncbi:MAG: SusC/RagA family TonB-linked outer membrane protein [Flavobacteriaceae bacterium]